MGGETVDTKDLKSFEMVYELQSINKAAKRLYITPQGLSNMIKHLEQELETSLFIRDKNGVKPTASAVLLYKRAKQFNIQLEKMKNEMEQLNNRSVKLRIGCACGSFNVLPFEHIQEFMKHNSQLQVELCEYTNEEVKKLLLASKLEYGFIIGEWENERIEMQKQASRKVQLIVYEGHPLWQEESVTIDQLENEPLILLNEHFTMYHDLKRSCQVRGFEPRIIAKTADINFQHKLCRKKMGLAFLPDFITDDFDMIGLKAIPFKEELKWEVFGAYEKDYAHYEVIQMFRSFLEKYRDETSKKKL